MTISVEMQRTKQMFLTKMSVKSPLTVQAYEKRIKYFEEWWQKTYPEHDMISSLNGDDLWDLLQMYVSSLSKDLSPNTVWNYVTSLRKYLHYVGIKECDKDNFNNFITLPEKIELELYPLKVPQMQLLLDKMTYVDKALFLCQAACGARIGEMVQIKKKYFVMDNDRLLIKLPSTITKFHKARTVVLSQEAAFYLKPILAKLSDDDLVFTNNIKVRSAVTIKETVLRNALQRCNFTMRYEETNRYKINTHSFRAFFITKASRSDPNIAKKLAGEKGYLLQYDRLEDHEFIDEYKKFELDLCIYDTGREKLQREKDNSGKDKIIAEKDRQIDKLLEMVKELRETKSVNPNEATTELIMSILKDKKIIN